MDIGATLTQKLGPLPMWAWGGAALGVGFLLFRNKSGSTGQGNIPAVAVVAPPTTFDTGQPPSGPSAPDAPQLSSDPFFNAWWQSYQTKTKMAPGLDPKTKKPYTFGFWKNWWLGYYTQTTGHKPPPDINDAVLWQQYQSYGFGASSTDAKPGTGGARQVSIGSRRDDPEAYFHPSMKTPVRYSHWVRSPGVGGAEAVHHAAIHAVAAQAGVHPARLHALNPLPGRFIRIH